VVGGGGGGGSSSSSSSSSSSMKHINPDISSVAVFVFVYCSQHSLLHFDTVRK
jgi:hypothetical protein